jgi:hypothetical protein
MFSSSERIVVFDFEIVKSLQESTSIASRLLGGDIKVVTNKGLFISNDTQKSLLILDAQRKNLLVGTQLVATIDIS